MDKIESNSAVGSAFGRAVDDTCRYLLKQGIIVTSVKVKYPGIQPLIMVSTKSTEGPRIAFVGGIDLDAAGQTLWKQIQKGTIKWKVDQFLLDKLAQNGEGV